MLRVLVLEKDQTGLHHMSLAHFLINAQCACHKWVRTNCNAIVMALFIFLISIYHCSLNQRQGKTSYAEEAWCKRVVADGYDTSREWWPPLGIEWTIFSCFHACMQPCRINWPAGTSHKRQFLVGNMEAEFYDRWIWSMIFHLLLSWKNDWSIGLLFFNQEYSLAQKLKTNHLKYWNSFKELTNMTWLKRRSSFSRVLMGRGGPGRPCNM